MTTARDVPFEWFADAHPHEAAEQDWPRFAAYVRTKNPALTDAEIRGLLEEESPDD